MIWTKESSTAPIDSLPQTGADDYSVLRDKVREQGLFTKRPLNYSARFLLAMLFLAASITTLIVFDAFWIQVLNAAFLAFILGQFIFLVHDAGHNQIFASGSKNRVAGIWLSSLFLGGSSSWWIDKHNRHHVNPNVGGVDPDIEIPILALSPEAALSKKGIFRFIAKYQVFFFFPLLMFEALNLRFNSINHIRTKRLADTWDTIALIIVHHAVYFGLTLYFLGPWQALVFIAVQNALLGLYLGCTFATNHIGMPVIRNEQGLDYTRLQTLTARNLKASWLTGYLFGGLDSQIEHHLFPTVPRASFADLRKIVKPFCKERSIEYCEVSFIAAYVGVLKHLHQVGKPLRRGSGLRA